MTTDLKTGDHNQTPDPMHKMDQARVAAQAGRYAEALEDFLWCFDHGQEADPAFGGVQSSFLIDEILELARVYPPALQALVSRRDERAERLTASTASLYDTFDFVAINRYLGQQEYTLRVFRQTQPGTKQWEILGWGVRELLLEQRRYQELLNIFNPEEELAEQIRSLGISVCDDDGSFKSHLRRKLVSACAPLVEALAGLGQHERALRLADGIMGVVRTANVISELVGHAERAGDAVLADYLRVRMPKKRKKART